MKKSIALIALLLTGCATTSQVITTKEQIVIMPSESMYNCPVTSYYPKADTLTDIQIARLLVDLHKNNKICHNSIESIRKYLEEAKATVEEKK